jgi:clan AA aspartic protease (TIGR02281 family)
LGSFPRVVAIEGHVDIRRAQGWVAMIKKLLTTSAVLAGLTGAAQAEQQSFPIYLVCQAGQDMLTNSPPDGSVKISMLTIDQSGWLIGYGLANGRMVFRNDQYDISTGPVIQNQLAWAGRLRAHNNLKMEGAVQRYDRDASHFYYQEWLWDYNQGGKLVVHTQADCKRVMDLASMTPYASGPYASNALANAPNLPPAAPPRLSQPTNDSVPLYFDGRPEARVDVQVGSQSIRMLVDTGASMIAIPAAVSDRLIAAGEAEYGPQMPVTLANGAVINVPVINIHKVVIGSHVLRNVSAGVSPEGAEALLGFSVLNLIGKFTIDTQTRQLIFG